MAKDASGPDLRTQLAVAWLSGGDASKTDRAVGLLEQVRKENPANTRVLYLPLARPSGPQAGSTRRRRRRAS